MKKGFRTFLLMVLAASGLFIVFPTMQVSAGSQATKQVTIFGFISSPNGTEDLGGLPVCYKGGLYSVSVDKESEIRKAAFEIYEDEKPNQIHILIMSSEDLKIPDANHIEHLELATKASYKLYKLSKYTVDMPQIDPLELLQNKKSIEWRDSWRVQEIRFKDAEMTVPDNTVIIFMNPEYVDRLDVREWASGGTSIYLPTIAIKDSVTKGMIRAMRDRMVIGGINLRSFHKKPFKAIVQCASNRLISIPFNARGYSA
ncbi:MAG TPA: hypothetical protein VHO47_05015 [Candidatus Babeliales bacterium]|nr:hypothetical protein [Candidatus Babeliales bacterium]